MYKKKINTSSQVMTTENQTPLNYMKNANIISFVGSAIFTFGLLSESIFTGDSIQHTAQGDLLCIKPSSLIIANGLRVIGSTMTASASASVALTKPVAESFGYQLLEDPEVTTDTDLNIEMEEV